MNKAMELFKSGVHNLLPSEKIPDDAAQDSSNFVTKDGKVVLSNGRDVLGTQGNIGNNGGIHTGYKQNGDLILFVKFGTTIQYWDGAAWQNSITGLTDGAEYTFNNYSSLAGVFTYVNGPDGFWKIITVNPADAIDVYDAAKNFKGKSIIDKGRMLLWDRPNDKTGVYGSWIDRRDSTVYTAVTGEAIGALGSTNYTNVLAFKGGGATRSCFAVTFSATVAAGTELFTDNLDGTVTSNFGGTGTINYATGAYNITFSDTTTGAVTSDYQWEDPTDGGIADFSKSATRLAGEGFQFPQDEGGDPILTVQIGQDGAYYSLKEKSAYILSIDADDLGATNEVYRKEMGLQNFRSAVSSTRGIVFMNTANPTRPEMTILQRNKVSLEVEPVVLFRHFDFSKYDFTECSLNPFDRWVLVFCKTKGADNNDTILLCDIQAKTVDIATFSGKMSTQMGDLLYVLDSITNTVYETFSGFDDLGFLVEASWTSKDFRFKQSNLTKVRRLKFKGHIDPDQVVGVWGRTDGGGFVKVGEIRGDASYVNYDDVLAIGAQLVGADPIGGAEENAKPAYFMQIRLKTGKFRTISFKLIPEGIGYFDFNLVEYWDILTFEDRIPKEFRQKQ